MTETKSFYRKAAHRAREIYKGKNTKRMEVMRYYLFYNYFIMK